MKYQIARYDRRDLTFSVVVLSKDVVISWYPPLFFGGGVLNVGTNRILKANKFREIHVLNMVYP